LPEDAIIVSALNRLRGNVLYQSERYTEAVAEFNKAIRLDPHNAAAHNNLGEALNYEGKHDDAIAEYRQALRLNPNLCHSAQQPWCCTQ
jgi:Flp pilus assembly protein TadD